MLLESIPPLSKVSVDHLLKNIRLRGGSERNSARLAADLAIRDRSVAMLHVLATAAMPAEGWSGTVRVSRTRPLQLPEVQQESAPWWAALGRVCAALATTPADLELAGQFFDAAFVVDSRLRLNRADALACAQVYEETGRADQVRKIPVAPNALERGEHELFEFNTTLDAHGPLSGPWLALVNSLATKPYGLAPITVVEGAESAFDRVRADVQEGSQEGPLISIIMTTFQRGETLLTAVRSVREQTWRNWELLLIDDCSGTEHHALLDKVEALDTRIRVIRREVNEGTYAARNVGISHARGSYVTFQDDDDWSHPERLARQVKPLMDDPAVRVTMSYALHFTDSLHVRFGGRRTRVLGSSTLMTRTEDLRQIGGFDLVRKSGDTELIRRLDALAPQGRLVLPEPLALMRLTDGSLSRSDFGPGWVHPARSEYAEASMAWHRQITPGNYVSAKVTSTRSFPAPDAMLAPSERKPRTFDVVLVGDFSEQFFHGSAAALFLRAAVESGRTVGIVHLDSPDRSRPSRRSFIANDVRRLMDGVTIRRILPKDVAIAPVAVFASPEVMQFVERTSWDITVDEVLLACDSAPAETSEDASWGLVDCRDAIHALIGLRPTRICAHDHKLLAQLRGLEKEAQLEVLPLMGHVFVPPIAAAPQGPVAVIGRVGSHHPKDWPSAPNDLLAAYPQDGSFDVRFLGEVGPTQRLLGGVTATWLVFEGHELAVPLFIQQLDVYVIAKDRGSVLTLNECRIVYATLASGRPVVVSRGVTHPFGAAVMTCEVEQIPQVVQRLSTEPRYFSQQQQQAREWLSANGIPTSQLQRAMGLPTPGSVTMPNPRQGSS